MERILNYKAGTASECITPDEPLWLAGYAARTAPARGRISDLYATALALEDDAGERFVVASMDSIAISPIVAEPVMEAARARHGLTRRQILLTATHTHYGPEFRPDKQVFFNIPAEYGAKLPAVAEKLAAALTHTIDAAVARLAPVRLFARQATAGFAHNRRRHGVVAGKPSLDDVFDHDVPVLDCVDGGGNRKAIVFGYACHNTTIPLEDLRYSADWAGFAKERLERANHGAPALFIPGAGADQDAEPRGSVDVSRQHGQEIADAVQNALDSAGIEITGPIRSEYMDVPLTLMPVTAQQLKEMCESDDRPQRVKARFLLDQLDRGEALITSYPVPVQVVRFGDELLLVALSGESVVDWAHKFKRELATELGAKGPTPSPPLAAGYPLGGSPLVWVAGYCNDMFGYLPTRRVQTEGGYEGGRANLWSSIPAPFTEDVEERITAAVRRLVKQVGAGG
jgi:hypothetical protein